METVTLTIDGRSVTVEKGKTVLQAAIEAGISVPYYCYHPGLGIDGSCRVCVVKVAKIPKLQTSCSTICTDGMVVDTRDPEVVQARSGIFEFLLINHPLDCPVCDKGGECPLQDFSYTFGPAESRMDFPRRVFDGEGVKADVDFGPTLMLNRNRCILCTRCVRFMREVGGDAQIGIVDRGYGSEIATFREEGVHSLLSGNLMDVCPVGAITTRQYRFKSRPWDNPGVVDTICTFCSKGCNTSLWLKAKPEWARASQLIRVTPRFNPDVNSYWMCDIGRFQYEWVEGAERLKRPVAQQGGRQSDVPWADAITRTREGLHAAGSVDASSVRFLVSAHASVEELFVLRQFVDAVLGDRALAAVTLSWTRAEKAQPAGTTFEVHAVNAPNVNGARDLGFNVGVGHDGLPPAVDDLRTAVHAGQVKALYVIDPGPAGSLGDSSWIVEARRAGTIAFLAVQAIVRSELTDVADVVLPGASFAEKDAIFTNADGRVQAASRAIAPLADAREDWQIIADVARALGVALPYTSANDVRRALAAALPDTRYAEVDRIVFTRPVVASHWLQASNPSERWKWDFMYQDLPPVKGHNVQMEGMEPHGTPYIPVKEVK
jgi:NADH-quinone oxidoreductase subunit G